MSPETEPVDRDRISRMAALLERELRAMPIEHWAFMLPAHLAVWHFIEELCPGVLGPVVARSGDPPDFEGDGASWFVGSVTSDPGYLDAVDGVMRSAVDELPASAIARGFLISAEPMSLPRDLVTTLTERVRQLACPSGAG